MALSDLSEIHLLCEFRLLRSLGKTVSSLAIHIVLTFFDGLSSLLKYKSTMSVFLQTDSVGCVASAILQAGGGWFNTCESLSAILQALFNCMTLSSQISKYVWSNQPLKYSHISPNSMRLSCEQTDVVPIVATACKITTRDITRKRKIFAPAELHEQITHWYKTSNIRLKNQTKYFFVHSIKINYVLPTQNGMRPCFLSSSIAFCRVSPLSENLSSVGSCLILTCAIRAALSTEECDYKIY